MNQLDSLYFLPLLLLNKNRANTDAIAKGKYLPSFKELLQIGDSTIKSLIEKGIIKESSIEVYREIESIYKANDKDITLNKEQQIRDLGFNLITIWESDWIKLNKCIRILQRKYKNSKLL